MADPLPVDVARQIGQDSNANIALVICFHEAENQLQIATWGSDAKYKQKAASFNDHVATALGVQEGDIVTHKDYRRAGEAAEKVDKLVAVCREARGLLRDLYMARTTDSDFDAKIIAMRNKLAAVIEDA